jgi:hypothetical protein
MLTKKKCGVKNTSIDNKYGVKNLFFLKKNTSTTPNNKAKKKSLIDIL